MAHFKFYEPPPTARLVCLRTVLSILISGAFVARRTARPRGGGLQVEALE